MERESEKGTSGVAIDLFSRINGGILLSSDASELRYPTGSPGHGVVSGPECGRSRCRSGAVPPPNQVIHRACRLAPLHRAITVGRMS